MAELGFLEMTLRRQGREGAEMLGGRRPQAQARYTLVDLFAAEFGPKFDMNESLRRAGEGGSGDSRILDTGTLSSSSGAGAAVRLADTVLPLLAHDVGQEAELSRTNKTGHLRPVL